MLPAHVGRKSCLLPPGPERISCMFTVLKLSPAVHQNYIGNDAEKSPFFLSVTLSDQNHQRVPQYRAILWRKTVSTWLAPGASPLLQSFISVLVRMVLVSLFLRGSLSLDIQDYTLEQWGLQTLGSTTNSPRQATNWACPFPSVSGLWNTELYFTEH